MPPLRKKLKGHVRTVPGNMHVKFEVHSFNHFRAISILRPKIYGITWPWPRPLFEKFLRGHVWTVPWNMHVKLKSTALTVLGLLAFNAQNLGGHVTLPMLLFKKILRDHVRTVPGNILGKFEVRSFNRFKLVGLTSPLGTHKQKHRQNHIEGKQYLRHSLRSLSGDNNC